jgi:hypothetical protein
VRVTRCVGASFLRQGSPKLLRRIVSNVISSPVPRLFALLLMLALVLTNGAAATSALCQHVDAGAHAVARASPVEEIAAEARGEEMAAAKAQEGTLTDAAGLQLAGFTMPTALVLDAPIASDLISDRLRDDPARYGRAISPLLDPPLA